MRMQNHEEFIDRHEVLRLNFSSLICFQERERERNLEREREKFREEEKFLLTASENKERNIPPFLTF